MNRNKQRAMLKQKREIGFHVLEDMPAIPLSASVAAKSDIAWRGVVKVQYAQAGAEAYLVYNQDKSITIELRRSQYSRAEWNKLLGRLGMHPMAYWNALHFASGELEFISRAAREAW